MPTLFYDRIEVGAIPIVFNDIADFPLSTGVVQWGLDVLDGWDETPELDGDFLPIGAVDGEVPPEYLSARGKQYVIGGYVEAVDRATAHALWDILVRDAFPRNVEILLTRHEPTPKSVRLWVNGPRKPQWVGSRAFRWGVPARSADPFKYGLTPSGGAAGVAGQATGGRSYKRTYPLQYVTISSGEANKVVVNNLGTGPSSRITIVLTGPLISGAWRLVNETTGQILKFDVGLTVTDSLEIDFYNEVAYLNGFPITATISGDFFRMVTGPNVIKLYADFDPSSSFTVTAYSAWE